MKKKLILKYLFFYFFIVNISFIFTIEKSLIEEIKKKHLDIVRDSKNKKIQTFGFKGGANGSHKNFIPSIIRYNGGIQNKQLNNDIKEKIYTKNDDLQKKSIYEQNFEINETYNTKDEEELIDEILRELEEMDDE